MNFDDVGTVFVVVSREEVEAGDISGPLEALKHLVSTPDLIRQFRTRVDLSFDGYNEVRDELFEIPQVRNYVYALDAEFPFWLYFMSRNYPGLQCILLCFLPPFLTEEARARIHPPRLNDLLEHRWVPALVHTCAAGGLPEAEVDSLIESASIYIRSGPIRPLQ